MALAQGEELQRIYHKIPECKHAVWEQAEQI